MRGYRVTTPIFRNIPQRYQAFTLDFEYRQMDQTWPLVKGEKIILGLQIIVV